ncbi:MAG TPA: type II toxin-antitoxin system PemK/MazF family toxin [Isosphaeraceae bacterium]
MTLQYGDIVIVAGLPDPHGRNPKDRPAIVVTPTDELRAGRPIFVVAITTTLTSPLPDDYVRLPWSRPRHPRTGLNSRNAAVCHWLAHVEESKVVRAIGRVPGRELIAIGDALHRLAGEA